MKYNLIWNDFIKTIEFEKNSDEYYINMYYQPMDVMEDGIVIDPRGVGTPPILNMERPITVNPSTKVTWLREEQTWNALSPIYSYIELIYYGSL